jgi:hypothetical protein
MFGDVWVRLSEIGFDDVVELRSSVSSELPMFRRDRTQ